MNSDGGATTNPAIVAQVVGGDGTQVVSETAPSKPQFTATSYAEQYSLASRTSFKLMGGILLGALGL